MGWSRVHVIEAVWLSKLATLSKKGMTAGIIVWVESERGRITRLKVKEAKFEDAGIKPNDLRLGLRELTRKGMAAVSKHGTAHDVLLRFLVMRILRASLFL